MALSVHNLRALIVALRAAPDEKFDIAWVFRRTRPDGASFFGTDVVPQGECGTAACVAGWCGWVASDQGLYIGTVWGANSAERWLGIYGKISDELFRPPGFNWSQDYTRFRAIAVLEHMYQLHIAGRPLEVRWDLYNTEGELVR